MSVKCPVSIREFPDGVFWIVDADGERIADDGSSAGEYAETMSLDTARRIVACVNACEGLPEAALKPSIIMAQVVQAQELIAQRDELLVALKDAVETIEWMYGCSSPASDEVEEAIREGNAAITKAKGGAA